jgi:YceI-like domain
MDRKRSIERLKSPKNHFLCLILIYFKFMKKLLLFIALFVATNSFAQKYFTRTGTISFYSKAPMENIEAVNKQVACIVDAITSELVFQVAIKSFQFEKALMQEHFNENYLESDKYPKAEFKGKIASKIDATKDGTYNVKVSGTLTIHGVSNQVQTVGIVIVEGRSAILKTTFSIKLKDYKIDVPSVVKDKIAETVKIVVNADCKANL